MFVQFPHLLLREIIFFLVALTFKHLKMDVIRSENIKVPNAVLVSGLSHSEADDYIFEFLRTYGTVSRVLQIDSPDPVFLNTAVVEYDSGAAIEKLKYELPFSKMSPSEPSVIHHIKLLSTLFTTSLGSSLTSSYITELKNVAKLGGIDFEALLQEELARIRVSTKSESSTQDVSLGKSPSCHLNRADVSIRIDEDEDVIQGTCPFPKGNTQSPLPRILTCSVPTSATAIRLPVDQLSTPDVQRLVVEHIVKGDDVSSRHRSLKLRSFSGKSPVPAMEVDYETWRSHIDFYLKDSSFPDLQVVRKIVESLLSPAATMVKHLGPQASSACYLSLLDSAYAAVGDGDELFAKFLSTNQNAGEKPSAYLHRLQISLSAVVKRGGLPASQMDRQLLKQFCRGCWNNSLITNLQLERKLDTPPSLSEFMLLLRTEEDKQAAKSSRMKQHLGFPKAKAQSNLHAVCDPFAAEVDMFSVTSDLPSETKKMRMQIADLQAQLASLKVSKEQNVGASSKTEKYRKTKPKDFKQETPQQFAGKANKKPRPWYCFNCGEDGHISPSCSDEPNPALVEAKKKELREKQRAWEELNGSFSTPSLN